MDEYNEQDSTSVMNSIVKDEDIEDGERELTATPLKRFVTVVPDLGGNKWICNFGCKSEPYTGTYSRVRAHLIGLLPGQKSQGVALCSKISKQDRERLKKEEEEAKRIFGGCNRKTPISTGQSTPMVQKSTTNVPVEKGKEVSDKYRVLADESVARFFYGCGIPLNAAKSPFWIDMVRAVNEAPKGYEPPSSEKIKTTLLDKEKTKLDQDLMSIKKTWPTYGVSIVSDGWFNVVKESFVKVMAVSEHKAMLISGCDCSSDDISSEYIAKVLLKAVEYVGAFNVVQILTDDSPTCKAAGKIVETAYPHIFWSGSAAHTFSLLLEDIANSVDPTLSFVTQCYDKAKWVTNYLKNHASSLYIFRTYPELNVLLVKRRKYRECFLTLERILRMKATLINMVLSEEWDKLKRSSSKSDTDHEGVKQTILDDDFWKKLSTVVKFMRPVWDIISYCSSDKSSIGEVYLRVNETLESVKASLPSNPGNLTAVIQKLFTARWEMGPPLYSLAYVLTPSYYSEYWLEKRCKPHADPGVNRVYLDVIDRLVKDSKEASLVRLQLSDFVSNMGSFGCIQAVKDRDTMSELSWWHLYGVGAPELYSLAIKVLSQCIDTTCGERDLASCDYIRNVKKNVMNGGRAESLVYVHYNHRLLTRNREDYNASYRNWDYFLGDDNLEVDIEAIEDEENGILNGNVTSSERSIPLSSGVSSVSRQDLAPGSSSSQMDDNVCKRRRLR